MRKFLLSLSAVLCWAQMANAASLSFDIIARIDSAFLRPASDNDKVPVGGVLNGRMTFSTPPSLQVGSDYFYDPGLEELSISTDEGFSLSLSNRVTSIANIGDRDFMTVQSFISEDPNGWNLVIDLIAVGWRNGETTLPQTYPDSFESAYISAYFLDEADVIQSVDATILSIEPTTTTPLPDIPLPPAGVLLGSIVLLGFWRRPTQEKRKKNYRLARSSEYLLLNRKLPPYNFGEVRSC